MTKSAAVELSGKCDIRSAIAWLEPWFKRDDAFVARREFRLDALLHAYADAGPGRKKPFLLERAVAVGDNVIRSTALERRTSVLADQGDYAAWQTFTQAQRADPYAVSLSHLEMTVLLDQGRTDVGGVEDWLPALREQSHLWNAFEMKKLVPRYVTCVRAAFGFHPAWTQSGP